MSEAKNKDLNYLQSHMNLSMRSGKAGVSLIHENTRIDQEKEDVYFQKVSREHNESEEGLDVFNKRLKNARERLDDHLKKRKEILKLSNTVINIE